MISKTRKGGARKGAGRPFLGQPGERVVPLEGTVTQGQRDYVYSLGKNRSQTLRDIIDFYRKHQTEEV